MIILIIILRWCIQKERERTKKIFSLKKTLSFKKEL